MAGGLQVMKNLFLKTVLAVFCLTLLAGNALAQLNLANGSASGQWYNPARDGEGFYVEIIDTGGNLQISVAMYSYNEGGDQLWLIGNVPIAEGDVGANVPVYRVEGPVWGPMYDPADRTGIDEPFGNIAVQFPTCDSALFNVQSNDPVLESGNYSLVRLTDLVSLDCVEPTPPDVPPPGPAPEVTPGLWTGNGVCFFVDADGTQIVDSDQCDNGKSFSARVDGVEVPDDNYPPCNAYVVCNGAWPIVDEIGITQTPYKQATCINADGGIGVITFAEDVVGEAAFIKVVEAIGLDLGGKVCAAGGSGNIIARPPQ
jgi:hypothetical protein